MLGPPAEMTYDTIMAEQDDWQKVLSQDADEVMSVYIDLKSPHAYLAIRPSIEIARDFKVKVDFLPYTLSYEALGVSKEVGPDMKREPASPAADRKARMYYAAAREYAALQALPFRSPYRLLDSDLAHRVLLFAKRQNLEVPFAMSVYLRGWGSGWREFELESLTDLRFAAAGVGVELANLDEFVADGGEGEHLLADTMVEAEQNGFTGAPHYVFDDHEKERKVGLFGREHLALIRSKYLSRGLARHNDVKSHFSHTWPR